MCPRRGTSRSTRSSPRPQVGAGLGARRRAASSPWTRRSRIDHPRRTAADARRGVQPDAERVQVHEPEVPRVAQDAAHGRSRAHRSGRRVRRAGARKADAMFACCRAARLDRSGLAWACRARNARVEASGGKLRVREFPAPDASSHRSALHERAGARMSGLCGPAARTAPSTSGSRRAAARAQHGRGCGRLRAATAAPLEPDLFARRPLLLGSAAYIGRDLRDELPRYVKRRPRRGHPPAVPGPDTGDHWLASHLSWNRARPKLTERARCVTGIATIPVMAPRSLLAAVASSSFRPRRRRIRRWRNGYWFDGTRFVFGTRYTVDGFSWRVPRAHRPYGGDRRALRGACVRRRHHHGIDSADALDDKITCSSRRASST